MEVWGKVIDSLIWLPESADLCSSRAKARSFLIAKLFSSF